MTEKSIFTGAFRDEEAYGNGGGSGFCNVTIDEDSQWIVSGDSRITTLTCSGSITDENGKSVTIQSADGSILSEGESEYTVTVDHYSAEM